MSDVSKARWMPIFFPARYRIAPPTRAAAVTKTPMIGKRIFFLNFGSLPPPGSTDMPQIPPKIRNYRFFWLPLKGGQVPVVVCGIERNSNSGISASIAQTAFRHELIVRAYWWRRLAITVQGFCPEHTAL